MKITEYGEIILNTADVIAGLYSGKITNLNNIFLDDLDELTKFNNAVKENFEKLGEIKIYSPPNVSVADFDRINQAQWFMPEEYKNFDIENWLLCQCPDIVTYNRVEEELALFRQHNMIVVLNYLKYLVDTMRQNNIVWGVGRGSSVASYCLYLLGVHKINSIKYELDIHEFLK